MKITRFQIFLSFENVQFFIQINQTYFISLSKWHTGKYMKKLLIASYIILLTISCREKPSFNGIDYIEFNDIDFENIVNLKSEELSDISDSLLFPTRLIVNDGYLLINEMNSNDFLHAVELSKNTYIGNYGNRGFGPGEILVPIKLSRSNANLLSVLDPKQKKIVEFNVDSLIYNESFETEYNLPTSVRSTSATIIKEKFFFLDENNPENRLYETGINGGKLIGYGKLPKRGNLSIQKYEQICLANMFGKDNLFSFSYHFLPLLEIFDMESSKWISVVGPDDYNLPSNSSRNNKQYYNQVLISDEYIYALFNGNNITDLKSEHASTLYVFNYSGIPIKKIALDKGIISFDIYKEKYIYGINLEEDPKILKFQM